MASPIVAPDSTTSYLQPQYYSDTAASTAGGIQGMLGNDGYLNSVMGSWYNQTPNQGAFGQLNQYSPESQQQFINPYTTNVAEEQGRMSNQNLFENTIPKINSTFVGAGQFGSDRNADFMNRAIRDQQYSLTGQLGNTMMGAQDKANQQYQDWTKMGTAAGQQDFQNWLTHANFPIGALGQMAQATSQIRPPEAAAITSQSGELTDDEKIASGIGAINTGASDIGSWLGGLWGGATGGGGTTTTPTWEELATTAGWGPTTVTDPDADPLYVP